MTQERFLLVPPGFTRDTVMRDMAHNSYRTLLAISTKTLQSEYHVEVDVSIPTGLP